MDTIDIDNDLKKELKSKYDDLRKRLTSPESRFFHLNTLDNFIFHFDEIKPEEDRVWVYKNLWMFFEACDEYIDNIDRKKGSQLFSTYLFKVAMLYRKKLHFALLIDKTYLIPFYLTFFIILYFTTSFWISLVPILIFFVHYFYNFSKYRQKRLYGMFL